MKVQRILSELSKHFYIRYCWIRESKKTIWKRGIAFQYL